MIGNTPILLTDFDSHNAVILCSMSFWQIKKILEGSDKASIMYIGYNMSKLSKSYQFSLKNTNEKGMGGNNSYVFEPISILTTLSCTAVCPLARCKR